MSDIVTKDYPVMAGEPTDEHPHGTFEVILSAPTKDRDGEIVDSKAFEPLPDHITFDTDHSMTCDSVVGSGVPSYAEDGTLRVKGGYASDERSQIIRQKVLDGHIRTTSVTFMAARRVEDEKGIPHVVAAELINGTFTPVPSNRESVVLASKSILAHELAEKVGARNSNKDAETIQAMHDASVSLGATCEAKSHTHAEEKTAEDDATEDTQVSDTEHSADEDASDSAAEQAAETDASKSADEGSVMSARLALTELEARLELGG
jgi:hypothetical protein